jgi:hypothetical protein
MPGPFAVDLDWYPVSFPQSLYLIAYVFPEKRKKKKWTGW